MVLTGRPSTIVRLKSRQGFGALLWQEKNSILSISIVPRALARDHFERDAKLSYPRDLRTSNKHTAEPAKRVLESDGEWEGHSHRQTEKGC